MTPPIIIGYDQNGRPITLGLDAWLTGMHVVGAPGSGKSKFLEHLIRQIIRAGHGVLVLDPHGPIFDAVVAYLARYRFHRAVYLLNLSDPSTARIFGFNPFLRRAGDPSTRVQRAVTAILKSWSIANADQVPRLLRWLKNVMTLMIERSDLTVAELPLLFGFANEALRTYLSHGTSVEAEWVQLNHLKTVNQFDEQIQSTKNRIDILSSATTTRRFLSLTDPSANLDIGRAMDEGAIVLCNLQPSPVLDPRNARTIGTLILSELFDCARQRKTINGRSPRPFFTIVDEVQNFLCVDMPEMFAQGRKYGVPLIVAHQFLDQLRAEDARFLAAVNGAARTKVCFNVGSATDALDLVGEIFSGINMREIKFTNWRTGFRPISTRERSITRTRGAAISTATGTTDTRGRDRCTSDAVGTGRTTGRQASRGTTVTDGESDTDNWSVTDTVGESDTVGTSRSRTTGFSHTDGVSSGTSVSDGTSSSHTDGSSGPADGSDGARSSSDTSGSNHSTTDTEGTSTSDTYSESETDTESETHTDSRSRAESSGGAKTRSRSTATSLSEGESDSASENETSTQSESASESRAHSRSRGRSENWAESVTDQPGTRHEEFREPSHELFSLDDQQQRLADQLRLQPPRHFTVRTPEGSTVAVVVPEVTPVQLSHGMVAAYEAEIACRIGALPAEEVDALIERRRVEIEQKARQDFDAKNRPPVHFEYYEPAPIPLKRRTLKKTPPQGTGGPQG